MRKRILLFLLIPAILLAGAYLYLRFSIQKANNRDEERIGTKLPEPDTLGGKKVSAADLRPLLIERMQLLLKKSSNNLYNLSVGDLNIDMATSTLSLQNVKLQPDSLTLVSLKKNDKLPENVFIASFGNLTIEGVNLDDILTSKTLDFKSIKLSKPDIVIRRKKVAKKESSNEDFSQRFLKEIEKLSINQLQVDNGTITVYNDVKKDPPLKLSQVAVNMNNILVDSAARLDKQRPLFAKEATLSFKDYRRATPDGLYVMRLDKAEITAHQRQVKLQNFSFTSPFNKQEFTAKQKLSKELYNVTVPAITITGVDWWDLLNEEKIEANEITASGGKLSIFLDRRLPPKNKMGNFPSQLLMKLPMKLSIAKASVKGLDFSYAEFNPLSGGTGTVTMGDVNLAISNLSNQTPKQPVTVNGSALFMKQVPLKATFSFDMAKHKSGAFTASIKAGGFDGTLINSFAEPMGLMKIERGRLLGTEATMQGDQWKSSGEVFIPYEDLKLNLMEKEAGQKKLDKKDVTSFAANLLVIKNNNPKEGKKSRREATEFTRIPEGGFFMLVWKTVLVGALRTMGAPDKIAYKTVAGAKKN